MRACTSKISVSIFDITNKIPKTTTFKVQEQITSDLPDVFLKLINDSAVFVYVRGEKLFVVGGCQKMYNSFSDDLLVH